LYPIALYEYNIEAVVPDKGTQEIVHDAIYNPDYGVKSKQNPVSEIARMKLEEAVRHLQKKGAQAIVMGCTEIPLVFTNNFLDGILLIDPSTILARALIRETYPNKLKAWS
jgi:aspartate racemase